MNINEILIQCNKILSDIYVWITTPDFYTQLGLVIIALLASYSITVITKRKLPIFSRQPDVETYLVLKIWVYKSHSIIFPLLNVLLLTIVSDFSLWLLEKNELIKFSQGLAVVLVIYSFNVRFVRSTFIHSMINWVIIPASILEATGLLTIVINYMEALNLEFGGITLSLYGVARVVVFGAILFWLGRISNQTGQRIIRQQVKWDIGTREVFAKLYQVTLIFIVILLLLQIMGINLTALAVFGGALGVGLGFGLQSIASNFISGMILLLDRSLSVGDYIELADGQKGIIRELNMRSTTLETFDGKDVMVPNEQFITTSFINWTHKNHKQRYSIEFQVSYSTDLHALFDLLREVVSSHPKVISGDAVPIEEKPDAEIAGFGDSGVNILIEFWMQGIDDGENRVGGDLYLMIWDALKENDIEIPFPQREIKIV